MPQKSERMKILITSHISTYYCVGCVFLFNIFLPKLSTLITTYTIDAYYTTVHSGSYTRGLCFITVNCGLAPVAITLTFKCHFTGTGGIMWLPRCQWTVADECGQIYSMNSLRSNSDFNERKIKKTMCTFGLIWCICIMWPGAVIVMVHM